MWKTQLLQGLGHTMHRAFHRRFSSCPAGKSCPAPVDGRGAPAVYAMKGHTQPPAGSPRAAAGRPGGCCGRPGSWRRAGCRRRRRAGPGPHGPRRAAKRRASTASSASVIKFAAAIRLLAPPVQFRFRTTDARSAEGHSLPKAACRQSGFAPYCEMNAPGALTLCTHSPLLCLGSWQRGFSTVCGLLLFCGSPERQLFPYYFHIRRMAVVGSFNSRSHQ